MRPTTSLTVALVVLFTVLTAQAAAPGSVADAKKALETARANLTKAIQLIDKDPPSTADLDAAPASVAALKDAIDAGAKFEGEDLDYAKAVLAARKELRTQRDYIDARRAKVHIFEKRRTIEAQASALAEKVKRLDSVKEPGKEFDEARAAIADLKKVVDAAREFTKQDEKFAAFVSDTDAALGRHERAVDDRLVALSADKQRGLLEQSRKALASAVGALNKGSTDAQFESAEKAWGELTRRLDEGKFIEPKVKAYKADADKARAEMASSRKKMDDLFAEVGVERLKAEIEPANKDLLAAAKAVRSKGASEDQLAEARTVAIVVRKLVEKYSPQSARSQAFGNYLEGVKKTLVDVETELLKRGLDNAKSAVTAAVRKVEAKAPTEEQFEAANAALANLDKTLNAAGKPDPSVAALVDAARELWRTSQMTVSKRRVEVSLGAPVQVATKALWKVEAKSPTPTDADFDAAEKALAAVEKVVEPIQKPDPSVAEKVSEARSLVKTGRASVAKRRAEVDLEAARKAVTAALRPVEGKSPTDDHFAELNTALTVLDKTIDATKDNKDAALALADARELARVARLSMNKRRVEVSLGAPVQAATKALWKVEAKAPVPTDADFEAAEKALAEVEKIVEPIQKPDPSVAAQVNDAKVLVKVGRQTLAKRRVEVSLGAPVQAATKAMWKVEAKNPAPTDADFEAAEKALAEVEKIVQPIEKPDASVAAKVNDAKVLVKVGRTTLAKRKAEVGLTNAQKDVTKALRFVEGKNPTDDHFAEATTAITILEKTLETAKNNKDAAATVADARQALRDAKASVEKRRIETNLDKPRAAVTKSLIKLDGRAPADADFEAANKALADLEKTLEPLGKPPASVAVLVQESKSMLKTGKAAVIKRRLELDVEAQKGKVEEARKDAVPLMAGLARADKDGVTQTENALKKIVGALDAGTELTKRDKGYAFYDGEVRKRVVEMNERIAGRKVAIAGSDGATLLRDLMASAKAKIQTTRSATSTEADLEAAVKTVDAIKQTLEERAELEYNDPVYGKAAEKTKDEMGSLKKDLEFAKQSRELRKRTVDALVAGLSAADAAGSLKDMRAKKAQFDKAIALLQTCERTGASMLEENKALNIVAVNLNGSPSTPKDVVAVCAQKGKETEQASKQVEGLIGFEDGPKKAYEKAKALLGEKKKSEALAQFKECIPAGMILQNRNPELKDRKFEVGGSSMTVPELIKECIKQRDALEK
ncbi:MAG TPA: hypothetical protein VGK67_22050 [Myxococcales bacterium]|jgi:hypothetical protein